LRQYETVKFYLKDQGITNSYLLKTSIARPFALLSIPASTTALNNCEALNLVNFAHPHIMKILLARAWLAVLVGGQCMDVLAAPSSRELPK